MRQKEGVQVQVVQADIVGWQINLSAERDRERERLAAPLTQS